MNTESLQSFQKYAAELAGVLADLPWQKIDQVAYLLHEARLLRKRIFVVGNGGSASTASHMACDLNKNTVAPGYPRFMVMSLVDNMAAFSANANDCGYANVFSEQLANFMVAGDIVLAISTSGNSANVLEAVRFAKANGALTIGWTGFDGGALANEVDLWLNVPSYCIEQVEDVHLILEHMLTKTLREGSTTQTSMFGEAMRFQPETANEYNLPFQTLGTGKQ